MLDAAATHSGELPCTLPLAQLSVVARPDPPARAPLTPRPPECPAATAEAMPADQTHPLRRKPDSATPAPPGPALAAPRLRVLRGLRLHVEYPLYEGPNYLGRNDVEPVDIDLGDQEPADKIWASRRHAVVTVKRGVLTLEDLHSSNGTFVNRHRLYPGQTRALAANDIVQIGTVQLKVLL